MHHVHFTLHLAGQRPKLFECTSFGLSTRSLRTDIKMPNTRTAANARRITPTSVEGNTEIYEDLDITLDDIPEKPGFTTILQRPGGRIIRHAANPGGPGNINGLTQPGATGTSALQSATQAVGKTIAGHPVASAAVFLAIGYLIGRKRR